MKIVRSVAALQAWRHAVGIETVALVPTMGSLHAGHLALLKEARARVPQGEGMVALSIFVNPTQFNRAEDLHNYPSDEQGDLRQAEHEGVDLVFIPQNPKELYAKASQTWVNVDGLDARLCGGSRPGHFRGVCTVVAKLWGLFRPDIAIFGQKDFQQLAIIRRMHADLFLSGEVIACPTQREHDGLALSSRNARLSAQARRDAPKVFACLQALKKRVLSGDCSPSSLREYAEQSVAPGVLDYVELLDAQTLAPIPDGSRARVCAIAVEFEGVRLIDNLVIPRESG